MYCGDKPSSPPNDTLTLQHVCPTIQSYIKHHDRLTKDILSAEKNINQILGHLNNTRSRRAILGLVGRFAKSLFGVSTEGDTRILAQQIRQIREDFDAHNENTLAITQTFQSYIVKADKKFELLNQAIKLTDEATQLAATLVKQAIDNEFMFTHPFNILHLYGAQYTDVLLDIKTHLLQTE